MHGDITRHGKDSREEKKLMRILYLRTNTMQCEPHIASVLELGVEVIVFDYFVDNAHEKILNIANCIHPTHVIVLGGATDHLELRTLLELKKTSKVILLVPEASHPDWKAYLDKLENGTDLIVNLDGNYDWDPERKHHTTLAIYGQQPYWHIQHLKDIDVGFCGGPGAPGTMRQRLIDYLKEQNSITVFPFIEEPGTYQQYADFMKKCKIIVNAAGSSGDKSKHVKGRVIEAGLARCCLLEEVGSPIDQWFSKRSYFTFSSPENCKEQIDRLLVHDQSSSLYAAAILNEEVYTKYNPRKMWKEIFDKI